MNQAKFFSIMVVAIISLYGAVGFYFLPHASFEGALTRMAMLPESDFGWTKKQPTIYSHYMKSSRWQDADMVAIGDSFTYAQLWQTELERHGVHVKTITWENIANICEDMGEWLRKQGFRGKYVVIESAEMYFEERLAHSVSCSKMRIHPVADIPATPPQTHYDRHHIDYSGKMSVGFKTKINEMYYHQLSENPTFKQWNVSKEVVIKRLKHGCTVFSHARCNDVLFYTKDRIEDFDEHIFKNMDIIQRRLNGFRTLWMVIPDKSTVYLYPEKTFWDKAEYRYHAPNILKRFRQEVGQGTMDLYRGNDTHTSTTGFLILGELMYQNYMTNLRSN